MGCNCKARNDFNKIVSKYGEVPPERNDSKLGFKKLIDICISAISKIIMGILLCVLFIVISIPIVLYVGVCLIFGKEAHIKLLNFKKNKKDVRK